MAQLIVRNLEDVVVRALRERAAKKERSTEAEHREVLRDALAPTRRAPPSRRCCATCPPPAMTRTSHRLARRPADTR